ncbi:hypothetical protein IKF92_03295 [Candidatus Saccharibacteria bacterium]|nr:hypothetical protein [Candidatus Saccharibacteria bacterium]
MELNKLTKIIPLFIASIIGLSLGSVASTYAISDVCSTNAPAEVKEAAGCNGNSNALPGVITAILNSIIAVSGLVAVVFIIVGGVNYMTSNGDAAKIEKAKKTILYACIGLVVCVLAFAVVNWAIEIINKN